MNTTGATKTNDGAPRKPGRLRRRIGWAAGVLTLLFILLVLIAPMIASSLVPGIIESAVGSSIAGKVRVEKVSLGWFSPTSAGPITLSDDKGQRVATIKADTQITLYKAIAGRLWRATDLDLGTVALSGDVDLIEDADGRTNLSRAIAPRAGARASSAAQSVGGGGGGASAGRSVRASLKLDTLSLTRRVTSSSGTLSEPAGVENLAGTIDLALDNRKGTNAKAKGKLIGVPVGPGAGADSQMVVDVDADVTQGVAQAGASALASFQSAKVNLNVGGAPVALIDALSGMGGGLLESMGPTAGAALRLEGTLRSLDGTMRVTSSGLTLDMPVRIADGRILAGRAASTGTGGATGPDAGTIRLVSTKGLSLLPQFRPIADALDKQVKLTQWPAIEVALEQLRVPSPVDSAGNPVRTDAMDFRGASAMLRVRASAMGGRVFVPDAGGGGGGAPAGGSWKPFSTEPIEFNVTVADLTQGASLTSSTRATLDGQPAGDVAINITATGLLDERGRVRALVSGGGLASSLDADVLVRGLSTALVAPVLLSLGLPVDVREDIGESATLHVGAKVSGDIAPGGGGSGGSAMMELPPLSMAMTLEASNASAAGTMRLDRGVVTTGADGFTARINSCTALARRLTNPANTGGTAVDRSAESLAISGRCGAEIKVTDLRADLGAFGGGGAVTNAAKSIATPPGMGAIAANVQASLSDVSVRLPSGDAAQAGAGAEKAQPLAPIELQTAHFMAVLAPGTSPAVRLDSTLTCVGEPFKITGDIRLEGVAAGATPKLDGSPLDKLTALRPIGTIAIEQAPWSVLSALPGGVAISSTGVATNSTSGFDTMQTVRDLVGKWATVSVKFAPDQDQPALLAGRLLIETQSKAAQVSVVSRFEPAQVTIARGSAYVKVEAATLNPVLARLSSAPQPISLSSPTTLHATITQPFAVPILKAVGGGEATGSGGAGLSADLAKMGDVVVAIVGEGDLGLSNIAIASGVDAGGAGGKAAAPRSVGVKLSNAKGQLRAPTGSMSDKPDRPPMSASLSTSIAREDGRPVAEALLDATISGNRSNGTSTAATLTLDKVSTATLDDTLALDGLLQGFIGDSAKVVLSTIIANSNFSASPGQAALAPAGTKPATQAPPVPPASSMTLRASIEAPRIRGASLSLVKDNQRIALTEPANIVITPDAAFLNKLAGAPVPSSTAASGEQSATGQKPRDKNIAEQIGDQMTDLFGSRQSGSNAATVSGARGVVNKLRVLDAAQVDLKISKLSVAVPQGVATVDAAGKGGEIVGPLKPGIFDLDVAFDTPRLGVEIAQVNQDGSAAADPARVRFAGLRGSAKSNASPDGASVQVNLSVDSVAGDVAGGGDGAANGGKPSNISATISRLSDARGVVQPGGAIVNADVDVATFPTPIVDQFAGQNGLMTEVLGPTVSMKAKLRDVSRSATAQSGSIEADLKALRATAQVKGDVRNGAFVQTGPTRVTIVEIRPRLMQMLAGSMPVVDSFEKSPKDEPAVIEMSSFEAPIDGQVSKLNGRITVDLGVARFTTTGAFGQILKSVGGKTQGTIGRKLEPFVIEAKQGVLDYQRFRLPLGEFSLETQGKVDLVNRQVRVTTYAPFFAIAEEALGPIKLGLGGTTNIIDRNTLVPITTRGSIDNPKTEIDAGEFLKGIGKSLIQDPAEGIGKTIGDLLGGKKKDKKDDKKK